MNPSAVSLIATSENCSASRAIWSAASPLVLIVFHLVSFFLCSKFGLPQLFLHLSRIRFDVVADVNFVAQGFELLYKIFNMFFPRCLFRLLFLSVQNLALAGKMLNLVFQICFVGLNIIKSFQAMLP